MAFSDHPILIFDGACGTNLQQMEIPDEAWAGCEGCNEVLNLHGPEFIVRLHSEMLAAGAMVVETDTFGASSVVLAEYGLQDKVKAINRLAVEHARTAIAGRPDRYVAGSVGPGTKLPSLGHIEVAELAVSIREQVEALLEAGVDCLIIETCQDLLQTKTALVSAFEVLTVGKVEIPVLVSVTIEQQGTMLVGSDIGAVVATLEPFELFSLGLNCATGPQDMASHVRYLSRNWPARISCIPNQGLPEVVDGRTVYPLSPNAFAEQMHRFVTEEGVSIVGGCCGTSPDHIRALAEKLAGVTPKKREVC
ncbi:5-methyltetrahydrofolate--homocysteine methyltransferase [Geothermobacter hydrogeniphilus]|uniref:Methionine synthase n=1 Tax=Geothermobacter hydrogeniphilus TaxID=1969733 RepID=A0A2K2HEH9_9BACT|nr:homocysteine S-methyltransferase family protein [Geothermobacter hydrogeniphilus]PNU21696.1 5-methyltetrahydrofolate--homocysteine methyltransferase [Geothermobacter hydrogeniphilus]